MNNIEYENKTSIIIPARNYDFILDNTIKKIRELYKNIKIVLILDDINIINYSIDSNTIVLKSNLHTMSAKRNQGVLSVNSEYIALLDSDAYPKKNWLENGINFLEKNNNYTAVVGNWFNAENDNFNQKCVRIQRFLPLFSRKEWWKIIDTSAKEQDITEFTSANVIIKRKDYIDSGLMNELIYIAEDIEFSGRLTKLGYKLRFVPGVDVFHREAEIYPYLRKVFCCGYYYLNNIFEKYINKNKKVYLSEDFIWHTYPLIFVILYFILWILFVCFKITLVPLFILTIFMLIPIILSSLKGLHFLKNKKLKGFITIFSISILFCLVYVIGSFLGILNIPTKSIYKMYKHY